MKEGPDEDHRRPASDYVAIILASGITISLVTVTGALLWASFSRYVSGANIGLSENGTQLLTGWGGGIIGVLGSYIGYTFGKRRGEQNGKEPPKEPDKT